MINEAMFEDLLTRVREYAQQRRLEETLRKTRGDPMDISLLNQWGSDYNQSEWYEQQWYDWNQEWVDEVDTTNKGKGKNKEKEITKTKPKQTNRRKQKKKKKNK